MSSPRRLWSGDWEHESALRAEELAALRRARAQQPAPEEPAAGPEAQPPAPLRPTAAAILKRVLAAVLALLGAIGRALFALRRRIKARIVVPIVLALALVVAIAFAVSALFGGSSGSNLAATSASVVQAERWLGVQLASLPHGGVSIETVAPNGAGALNGLEPGDVISQIGARSIYGLGDAASAIDRLSPGDQAQITVTRGSSIYTTSFPMPARPAGP
jgi:membrane-associated protease RseP (regulator of RpoE activity)